MEEYVTIFKSLSDKTRLRILRLLLEAKKSLCVCEIMDSLQVEQYNVSSHIKELRMSGLVTQQKDGRFVFYSLNKQKSEFIKNLFKTISSIPQELFKSDLTRLKKRLSLRVGCKVVVTMKKRSK
jgi:ArsR family transcriptional regulator